MTKLKLIDNGWRNKSLRHHHHQVRLSIFLVFYWLYVVPNVLYYIFVFLIINIWFYWSIHQMSHPMIVFIASLTCDLLLLVPYMILMYFVHHVSQMNQKVVTFCTKNWKLITWAWPKSKQNTRGKWTWKRCELNFDCSELV